MQKHVKVYFKHFGYGEQSFVPCEVCQSKAVDIHHIHGRGKNKDIIQNLVALCRTCHNLAHSDKDFNEQIDYMHQLRLKK